VSINLRHTTRGGLFKGETLGYERCDLKFFFVMLKKKVPDGENTTIHSDNEKSRLRF
jgi:hypothetical protein